MITQDTQNMATFTCLHCQTQRPYGFTHDDCSDYPLINCETCKIPTRHVYARNNRYVAEAQLRADKIVSITFTRAHNNPGEIA